MWVRECVRCKFTMKYKSCGEMKVWEKITVRGNEEEKRCKEKENDEKKAKMIKKSVDWLQNQTDIFIKSGIYEFWFWFIAFLRLTRFPANDLMLPTAVVDRSPKFFNCDAAAFMLALLVGWEREEWEGRSEDSSRERRGHTKKRRGRRGGVGGNKKSENIRRK